MYDPAMYLSRRLARAGHQSLPDLGDDKAYDPTLPPQFTLLPVPCGNLASQWRIENRNSLDFGVL